MSSKVWDEITYPFANFNICTVEVWDWISNFFPQFIMDVLTYPCWDLSQNMLVKRRCWWKRSLSATESQILNNQRFHMCIALFLDQFSRKRMTSCVIPMENTSKYIRRCSSAHHLGCCIAHKTRVETRVEIGLLQRSRLDRCREIDPTYLYIGSNRC